MRNKTYNYRNMIVDDSMRAGTRTLGRLIITTALVSHLFEPILRDLNVRRFFKRHSPQVSYDPIHLAVDSILGTGTRLDAVGNIRDKGQS